MNMTKEQRDEFISVLYDKCSKGEISRDQREKLIQKVNSMFVVPNDTHTTPEVDACVPHEHTCDDMTPKQKYEMFKALVYKKWHQNEIDTCTREELLVKARELFCPTAE